VCEAAAVSIYDKEADYYTQQAVDGFVSVPTKQDADDMLLNQVAVRQRNCMVRIHVDSCDATHVQNEYANANAAADSGNQDIVTGRIVVTLLPLPK
jgi:propanediol utilization protein